MSPVARKLAADHAALMASTSRLAIGVYWLAKAKLVEWQRFAAESGRTG